MESLIWPVTRLIAVRRMLALRLRMYCPGGTISTAAPTSAITILEQPVCTTSAQTRPFSTAIRRHRRGRAAPSERNIRHRRTRDQRRRPLGAAAAVRSRRAAPRVVDVAAALDGGPL